MAKKPGYTDALKVLGAEDSAVLDFAEKLLDAGLGSAGVPDLFGLRTEIISTGRGLLTGIRERITGVSRWDRTQRIDAAYRILLTVSLFEALEEALDDPDTPGPPELGLTEEELHALAERMLDAGVYPPLELSGASASTTPGRDGGLHLPLGAVQPLGALAESHSERSPRLGRFLETVTEKAQRRFQESYRRLAADVPEFGVWVNLSEHRGTRAELATGLAGLEELLLRLSPGAKARRHVQELHSLYRRTLQRPVLSAADAPDHLTLPSLEQAYINPRGRVSLMHKDCQPASEKWWQDAPAHDDLQRLLAGYLTRVGCSTHPIVILGHPGGGKSKLTEMLTARLPTQDFLPVRVELRGVSADAPVRNQIEEAVSAQLHRDVAWRDLVESTDGAQPVVVLDGFDELLQATGVNRSDYLEQVQRFQEDQAAMGQPVAVIVTTRTVVADRVRFPLGCVLVRLEPFTEDQIARTLDVWNFANSATLASRGLGTLSLEAVLEYRELAEQPLLLLMLLLYDADGNALQRAGALSRSELYERMLTMFARREIGKHHPNLSDREIENTVQDELHRLEVVAMAVFTRHRQSVTAEELDRDLAELLPESSPRAADTRLHGAVSGAHQALGRFFFVHESRARQDGRTTGVYEFLHSTFAEFLVARMVATTLDDLVTDRRHAARRRFAAPLDDGLLYAVASFAGLCSRSAVVEFTGELLRNRLTPAALEEYRELLIELFREAPFPPPSRSFAGYAPRRVPIATRQATYMANLVVLAVVGSGEIELTDLFRGAEHPWQEWRSLANQWRGFSGEEWFGLLSTLRVRYFYTWDGNGSAGIELERGDPVNVGECLGFELRASGFRRTPSVTDPYGITVPFSSTTSNLLRSTALRANGTAARMFLMLGPYLAHVSADMLAWYTDEFEGDAAAWGELHDVLELRLAPLTRNAHGRLDRFRRLLNTRQLGRLELLTLRQAAEDLSRATHEDHVPGLPGIVAEYLHGLDLVVPGPRLSREEVTPVLEALRPHTDVPDGHLDRLLDGHDRLETAEPRPFARRSEQNLGGSGG